MNKHEPIIETKELVFSLIENRSGYPHENEPVMFVNNFFFLNELFILQNNLVSH